MWYFYWLFRRKKNKNPGVASCHQYINSRENKKSNLHGSYFWAVLIAVCESHGISSFIHLFTYLFPQCGQVNQKMILTLTASIMYWSLQQPSEEPEPPAPQKANPQRVASDGGEDEGSLTDGASNPNVDDDISLENGNPPEEEPWGPTLEIFFSHKKIIKNIGHLVVILIKSCIWVNG